MDIPLDTWFLNDWKTWVYWGMFWVIAGLLIWLAWINREAIWEFLMGTPFNDDDDEEMP